ncbi:hypothetical protein JX265_001262 [Neoarthrinium moseri]|uniref:Protein Zds1 C-terminal domain-containing protein n=1 Tax=Neoarthrinium moseri TaxID=1658444 RepID=A0A9Q0AUD0_9PEZI|nr:hypothetical protein JX265_001262 [Neoarthrinium moseri]
MTSSRPRHVGNSFASRRGHANQLSISDSSHHITETIGTLYGDDDDYQSNDRPLSFIASPYGGEQITRHRGDPQSSEDHPLRLVRSHSDHAGEQTNPSTNHALNGSGPKKSHTLPGRMPSQRNGAPGGPLSPKSPTLREMRGGEASEFPMGSIENPSDIAQELSNLQALRRMSMDVSNTSDPDLLPFQNMSLMAMPSIAPQGDDDEADPSRLLWVPAGVHPELAPTEFKNFLEKRVQTIKRRSNDSSLSVDGLDRSNSGSLRRKKSMLSRQIDNAGGRGADGYMDGAERLERKKSTDLSGQPLPEGLSLDELVKDPSKAVQKLTLESQQTGGDSPADDMPILPVAPGMGLRRSTRTTYRKGGSLKDRQGGSVRGDRLPFSKRIAARKAGEDAGDASSPILESPIDAPPGHGLSRVQSEPVGPLADNYSRPSRSVRRQQGFTHDADVGSSEETPQTYQDPAPVRPAEPKRIPSNEGSRAPQIPQIIESPAFEDELAEYQSSQYQSRLYPERSSSQPVVAQPASQPAQVPEEPPARSSRRPNNYGQPAQAASQPQPSPPAAPPSQQTARPPKTEQSLNEMAHQPSPLPGGGATRTDSLTFIPTFAAPEERKPEKKGKKDSESKSTSWKWFKSDDKDKKKKEEKKEEDVKKSKAKAFVEKAHDNVRLDVLQTSIDTVKQKGRESLLLDRDSVDSKLEEERRKEGHRKSESKKEKDGLFANFFGGKKKGDRDSGGRKSYGNRPLSPEPAPYRPLEPDVDYHWTRFPILEERAIYRMAHIKLANPRRALYSQVLLSNFMYAYLAKVQAMHPQIQVPQSPQQKRLQQEEERRRREQEQQYLEQQQAQESIEQYNFEYHRESNQYGNSDVQQSGDYPEDAEVYDYEHGKEQYGTNGGYHDNRQHDERDDMW